MSTGRAVLYELQPVRLSEVDGAAWLRYCAATAEGVVTFLCRTLPHCARTAWTFLRGLDAKHYAVLAGLLAYYVAVRAIHNALDAGPIVVILTALGIIFTVGLSDEAHKDGFSAYSAFNRGFQRMLGSLDADALLAQHVGGFGMGLMEEPDDDEVANLREDVANDPRERRAGRIPPAEAIIRGAGNLDDEPQNRGGSRKSGKKARRRNFEQRRELRRQREAALALGLADADELMEEMAMEQLIDEILAADNGDD
jgi:hypothetical protein